MTSKQVYDLFILKTRDNIDYNLFLSYLNDWIFYIKTYTKKIAEKIEYKKQIILKDDFIASTTKEFTLNTDLDSIEKVDIQEYIWEDITKCEIRYLTIPKTTFDENSRYEKWLRYYIQNNKIYFRWSQYYYENHIKYDITIHYVPKLSSVLDMNDTIPFEEWLARTLAEFCCYKYYLDENWETDYTKYYKEFVRQVDVYIKSIERIREPVQIRLPNMWKYTLDPWLCNRKSRIWTI